MNARPGMAMAMIAHLLILGGPSRAQGEEALSEAAQRALERAVTYVLSQQKPTGALADRKNETAMTALSLMALAAVGHQPTDMTPPGDAMRKALAFALHDDRVDATGYFGEKDGSRMYGHGIVTLMLAEMLGMGLDDAQDALIRERLTRACAVIVAAQEQGRNQPKEPYERGGWRYHPGAGDSDLSATVWQVMALRAAHNTGLDIPKATIEKAIEYIKLNYKSTRGPDGLPLEPVRGFAYQPKQGERFTSTAVGLLALQVCGEYASPEVRGAAAWLQQKVVDPNEQFFVYGVYYYAQGMYQAGGEYKEQAGRRVEDWLVPTQDADGSWTARDSNENGAGRVYSAAMAILSLSVRHHYLPIYQR